MTIEGIDNDYELKDSGKHRTFETGARRDGKEGKGSYHLLPPFALHALAIHYQKGGVKYAPRNWEEGIALSEFYDSAMRHANAEMMGMDDENHAIAWVWNAIGYYETKYRIEMGLLPKELDDMPQFMKKLKEKIAHEMESKAMEKHLDKEDARTSKHVKAINSGEETYGYKNETLEQLTIRENEEAGIE